MEECKCSSVILNPGGFTHGEEKHRTYGGGGAAWAPEPLDKVEEEHNVFSVLEQPVAYSL